MSVRLARRNFVTLQRIYLWTGSPVQGLWLSKPFFKVVEPVSSHLTLLGDAAVFRPGIFWLSCSVLTELPGRIYLDWVVWTEFFLVTRTGGGTLCDRHLIPEPASEDPSEAAITKYGYCEPYGFWVEHWAGTHLLGKPASVVGSLLQNLIENRRSTANDCCG